MHIGKAIVISFKDGEEEALERVLSVLKFVQIRKFLLIKCCLAAAEKEKTLT